MRPLQHGWFVADGYITFVHPDASKDTSKDEPSLKLISNALVYAKELERIV